MAEGDYEQQRLDRIARNKRMLESLQVVLCGSSLHLQRTAASSVQGS